MSTWFWISYGFQNGQIIEIMVVRDSKLVGNIPINFFFKDFTLCQLYIVLHGLFGYQKNEKH